MAITKTYDLLNINGVKGWIRDSWARRAIAALQQRVAAIVVPTKTSDLTNDSGFITSADIPPGAAASTTTPLMDGTAAVGTETAFARGDHRHPTDTSRQAALSTAQMAAVNSGVTAAKVQAWDGITVPTKTSELTNDSGYITAAAVPTETSDLVNDSGFITAADIPAIPSKTSDLTNDSGFITASSVPSAYTSNPLMDGTASAGSSTAWARGDHRHPTDTSRQAALSSTQLAAVNSGVTAAKVQEWDSIVVPTKTSELTNDSGFITSVPVQSVNGKTGAVNLTASDVGALPSSTAIPSKTSDLTNDSGYITASAIPSVPSASTMNPAMDGTASAGSSTSWSRGDHVHPKDSSKQDALTAAQLAAANSGITADDLAVNDASVLCTVTPIEPTLSAGAHYDNFGGCWYYKIGHRVRVHIGVSGLTANTTTVLWTLPQGYRPYSGIAFTGQSSVYSNYARCRVLENGEVRVNAVSTYAVAYVEYDAFA